MDYELILGAILPFALEYLFKWVGDKEKLKFGISLVLPLLLGAGLNYNQLGVGDVDAILGSGAVIFAAAQGVYRLYFKGSKAQKAISK